MEDFREFLKTSKKANSNGNKPLHAAAYYPKCNDNLIEQLLSNGADLNVTNYYGETPLYTFLKVLRKKPCKDIKKKTFDSYVSIIKLLLARGGDPNIPDRNYIFPIMIAVEIVYQCDMTLVAELIKYGADLEVHFEDAGSLLHKVFKSHLNCNFELIKLLIEVCPQYINYKDDNGCTPLHFAVLNNTSSNIVRILLKNGADVNSTDNSGNTPLHMAKDARYSVLETLMRYGAEINRVNFYNRTPLLEVFMNFNPPSSTVAALLEFGSDINISDFHNQNPFTYVMENARVSEFIRLLLDYGANPVDVLSDTVPPAFYFEPPFSEHYGKILIPFFILYLFKFDVKINKPYSKLVNFKASKRTLRKILSSYRVTCISELKCMREDKLNDKVTVYDFVYDNLCLRVPEDKYPCLLVKQILDRIQIGKFPFCGSLLRASLKRNKLNEYLSSLIVYVNVPDSSDAKQSIILDYYSTQNLEKYLCRNTIFSLVQTFYDAKPVNSGNVSNIPSTSGVKRKYNV